MIENLLAAPPLAGGFDQTNRPANRTPPKREQGKGTQRQRPQWVGRGDRDGIPKRPYSDYAAQAVFEKRVARKHDSFLRLDERQSRIRYSRIMIRAR